MKRGIGNDDFHQKPLRILLQCILKIGNDDFFTEKNDGKISIK